jgi:hypothetical protein
MAKRRPVVVPPRANPGTEGSGAVETGEGGVAMGGSGTSVAVPPSAPTTDPAQGEFGFER